MLVFLNALNSDDPSGLQRNKDLDPTDPYPGKPIAPWEKGAMPYPTKDAAAIAAITFAAGRNGPYAPEVGGWILPVKGGFRPTPPQNGDWGNQGAYDPPSGFGGEYHLHPPAPNPKGVKLLPGPDNIDQWIADTGNGGKSAKMPIYIGDPTGDIYKHTPRPKHIADPRPPGRAKVISADKPGRVVRGPSKIGHFAWPE